MSERYELLSKPIPTGLGLCRWVADETIPNRVILQGRLYNFSMIEGVNDAAKIFADYLVEREYGDLFKACLVSPEAHLPKGIIFRMEAGTPAPWGGYYLEEPEYFAVLITAAK